MTVQAIRSKGQKARLYVYVPLSLATTIGLDPGEEVKWTLLDRSTLQTKRDGPAPIKTARTVRKAKTRKA
jgi:hypothetical protein